MSKSSSLYIDLMNPNLNAGINAGTDERGNSIESLTCKTTVLSSTGVFTFEVDGFMNLSDEVGGMTFK